MRVIHDVLILAGGLLLSAAPVFAGKVPAIQKVSDFTAQSQPDGRRPAPGSTTAAPRQGAHQDHRPKHGGIFFMSLDNWHHLEGVLVTPGIFRVYLYNDHTKPLKAEEIRKAGGTVQVGESDNAPKIVLVPGKRKETLEANLGNGVKFPVTITMFLHLPGMKPDAKPELFNFKFIRFTDERKPENCSPMADMPNMPC